MRDLKRYRSKRDPDRTPEPYFDEGVAHTLHPGAARAFVVQQHDARNMHWDLRLEIDGVLVSWAVPRGPSLDPQQRRLAVQTEDHPIEYGGFEGVIPAGNYGAGAMIVWDRGTYRCVDGVSPAQGLENGKLDLLMDGHKLRGRFALIRTRGEAGKGWLLISKGAPPEAGAAEIIDAQPASVFSGLRVDQLREGVSHDVDVEEGLTRIGARVASVDASELRPMLAGKREEAFSRAGWLFELKYDGVRVIAAKSGADVRIYARKGGDRTETYPEIAQALRYLPLERFVLDGEIVALDERGRSSFERLQSRFTQTDPLSIARGVVETPVVLYAFDLLSALGRDLRRSPLLARKEILARFVPRGGQIRFVDHVEGDGLALFAAAREHALEGILAKQSDSIYQDGQRTERWLKIKVPHTTPLAIVGWLAGRGSRGQLGSLMLAWHQNGELVYAGSAGSGLSERVIDELLPALEAARRETPAFTGAHDTKRSTYTEPALVCEVRYTEVTSAGLLRQPVFLQLREDLSPEDCIAQTDRSDRSDRSGDSAQKVTENAGVERPPAERDRLRAAAHGVQLTRLDKVFWPVEGYTKGDLLAYYEEAWPWIGPYLHERPLVLTRYPDGIDGKNFYQKNAPDFTPDWALRDDIEGTDYFVCNDVRTLLYVINSGAIPLHVWSARRSSLENPDWLILDLDPKQAPFAHVVEVARHIHKLLDDLEATHFIKTSGQDGLHVMLPLGAQLGHREATMLAEVLARVVVADLPEIATIARPVAARGDKVYVDFLQNGRGKLIAAPFSVRPRAKAPVSTPLTWGQVTVRLDPARWTIRTTLKRMRKNGDPMREILGDPVDVDALLSTLAERLTTASGGTA